MTGGWFIIVLPTLVRFMVFFLSFPWDNKEAYVILHPSRVSIRVVKSTMTL